MIMYPPIFCLQIPLYPPLNILPTSCLHLFIIFLCDIPKSNQYCPYVQGCWVIYKS